MPSIPLFRNEALPGRGGKGARGENPTRYRCIFQVSVVVSVCICQCHGGWGLGNSGPPSRSRELLDDYPQAPGRASDLQDPRPYGAHICHLGVHGHSVCCRCTFLLYEAEGEEGGGLMGGGGVGGVDWGWDAARSHGYSRL